MRLSDRDARQPPEQTLKPTNFPVSRGAPERRLRLMERYNRRARMTAYEPLTPTGTVRISFEVVDDMDFKFAPGMFVGIQAFVPDWGHRRSPYCIVSPPNEDRTFQLLVRLVPEGPLSFYLAELEIGDLIMFRGPTGRTMIPKETGVELILLATGVGIGPLLSLLKTILPQGFRDRIRLFWGLRLIKDICLIEDLEDLADAYPNFTYEISLTQPPPDWPNLKGRVTETVPPRLETLGDKQFYLVGNGAMIEEMSEALSDLGVAKTRVYEEHYFNFKHKPDPQTLSELRSRFIATDLESPLAHREELVREFSERHNQSAPGLSTG